MTPPQIRDWADFAAVRFEPAVWEPLVVRVLARHGLRRPSTIELTSSVHVVAVAGAAHDIWRCGSIQVSIPRHREINEYTPTGSWPPSKESWGRSGGDDSDG